MGERLVEAVSVFHELTSVFDALPTALANDELRMGADTLEQVAKECTAIHDIVPDQVHAMEALAAANVNIGKRLEMLRNNIQTIANIAINARIEASALKSNSQDMLTFTYDVAKLAATAEVRRSINTAKSSARPTRPCTPPAPSSSASKAATALNWVPSPRSCGAILNRSTAAEATP